MKLCSSKGKLIIEVDKGYNSFDMDYYVYDNGQMITLGNLKDLRKIHDDYEFVLDAMINNVVSGSQTSRTCDKSAASTFDTK